MIFRIGSGNLRTSVGTARIWSPAASLGLTSRSIDLDLVAAGEVRLAEALEVGERRHRLRRLPGDVEAQLPLGLRRPRSAWPARRDPLLMASSCALACDGPAARAAGARCAPTRAAPVSTWSSSR